jgi:hypothetical protein
LNLGSILKSRFGQKVRMKPYWVVLKSVNVNFNRYAFKSFIDYCPQNSDNFTFICCFWVEICQKFEVC